MRNLDIRALVSGSGLTYKAIAEEMGISRVWLSNLMRYDLTPKNRNRIVKAINTLRGEESAKEEEISTEIL